MENTIKYISPVKLANHEQYTQICNEIYKILTLQRELRRLLVSSPQEIQQLDLVTRSTPDTTSIQPTSPFRFSTTSHHWKRHSSRTQTAEEYSLYERPLQADTPAQNHVDIYVDTLVVSSTALSCDHQYNDYSTASSQVNCIEYHVTRPTWRQVSSQSIRMPDHLT